MKKILAIAVLAITLGSTTAHAIPVEQGAFINPAYDRGMINHLLFLVHGNRWQCGSITRLANWQHTNGTRFVKLTCNYGQKVYNFVPDAFGQLDIYKAK